MKVARIVVLTIALGAGGVAAYLARGTDAPKPEEPVVNWPPSPSPAADGIAPDPANAAQAFAKCMRDLGDQKLADADRGIADGRSTRLV